jgi:glycerol-3-phosphate acyltransferase PlsY
MLTYVMVAVVAYLLGSIPFGYILVKLFHGKDVRATGSGNIGATNVGRTSPALGIATLVLDAVKGFVAVLLASATQVSVMTWMVTSYPRGNDAQRAVMDSAFAGISTVAAVAALAAILGHVFPVWLKFKGGKGVATAVGAFAALAPKAILVVLVVFVLVVAVSRYVSLGSIVGAALFPVFVYVFNRDYPLAMLVVIAAASLIIILKHHENIRRLMSGTENRLGAKRA